MMRRIVCIVVSLLAVGASYSVPAHAGGYGHGHGHGYGHGHSHTHFGLYVTPSFGWNWYYPGPYAYPGYTYSPYYYPYSPPVVAAPTGPTTYIERSQPEEQAAPATGKNDWYYCRKPDGYYPYVRQCPGGWQRVPSEPQQ